MNETWDDVIGQLLSAEEQDSEEQDSEDTLADLFAEVEANGFALCCWEM